MFRFPQERAAEIAVETVAGFLEQNESVRQVIFDVYTDKDMAIYRRLFEVMEGGCNERRHSAKGGDGLFLSFRGHFLQFNRQLRSITG